MRVVNGLICEQGLVRYSTEEELDQKVAAAYRQHRSETFKSKLQIEWLFRKLRNIFVRGTHDKTERPVDHIAFLGLWDTVAAYGLPVHEMTRGVSRYLWPLELARPPAQSACPQAPATRCRSTTSAPLSIPCCGTRAWSAVRHRRQDYRVASASARSGLPACIRMSAADIRTIRSPTSRSPGSCPRPGSAASR